MDFVGQCLSDERSPPCSRTKHPEATQGSGQTSSQVAMKPNITPLQSDPFWVHAGLEEAAASGKPTTARFLITKYPTPYVKLATP